MVGCRPCKHPSPASVPWDPGWEHCPGCLSPPLAHQALHQPRGTAALITMEGNAELGSHEYQGTECAAALWESCLVLNPPAPLRGRARAFPGVVRPSLPDFTPAKTQREQPLGQQGCDDRLCDITHQAVSPPARVRSCTRENTIQAWRTAWIYPSGEGPGGPGGQEAP